MKTVLWCISIGLICLTLLVSNDQISLTGNFFIY